MNFDVTFDMDGVLIDSTAALQAAYLSVGVEMPADALGKPWKQWLVGYCDGDYTWAATLHERKTAVYPEILRQYGRRLPGVDVLVRCDTQGLGVAVVTYAASDTALTVVRDFLKLGVPVIPTTNKRRTLEEFQVSVHVDDHLFEPPLCTRLIRYSGDETYDEIMGALV